MNVPPDVKVWIVCQPLVVIVHPVDEVLTPSLPSVAYEIITIPLHHAPPHKEDAPHQPHPPHPPVFAVPLDAGHPFNTVTPLPPHPVHHVHATFHAHIPPHPHPPYVTEAPDIEYADPLPQLPPFVELHAVPVAHAPHPPHPQVSAVHDHAHQLFHPVVQVPAVHHVLDVEAHHHQEPQFTPFAFVYVPHPHPPVAVIVEKIESQPFHHLVEDRLHGHAVPPEPTVTVYAHGVIVSAGL